MSKRTLSLRWKGYYNYTSDNVSLYAPEKAGVYKLSVKLKNGNLKPFYVGQAKNLKGRFKKHLSDNEENGCIKDNVENYKCRFKYALVALQNDRDGAERALYLHYKPECNDPDAIPNEPDIDINYD